MDHNYHLTADEVNGIHQMVLNTAPSGRKEIKGLSSDRADIFIGATTAITSLLEYCGITDIYVSGYGLREGIIYEQMLTSRLPVNSVLDFSLENLLSKFRLNKHHARHVWFLSQTLFEQLILLHKIEASQVNILKTAALLHDCGINVNYYDHHLHSLYIILNSHINGLSHRELIMAAYTAAYHRKNNVKISEAHLSLLDYNDVGVIRKLGVILQIAEALDRRMQANVKRIDCQLEEDNVTLKLLAQHNPDLEIREALEASAAFCKLFGKQLYVVNG